MKARHLLCCLFGCILLVSLLPAAAFAQTAQTTINNITYVVDTDTGTATVKSGKPTGGSIVVPDEITYNGTSYKVTAIGDDAFYGRYGQVWQEAIIGANVESIGANAFGSGLDEVSKIQFNGSACQSIASDAFDWISLASDFELIVMGPAGCMDEVLAGVVDFTNEGVVPTYVDTSAQEGTDWLQQQVNNAPDGVTTTIVISQDISLTQTIFVPAGKDVVLVDDGEGHTITGLTAKGVQEMFLVKPGATLTFDQGEKGTSLTLVAPATTKEFAGAVVTVNGTLNLNDATLIGNKVSGRGSGAVVVTKDAEFVMTGGSISGFTMDGPVLNGTVVVDGGGRFAMSGGAISDNRTYTENPSGGGVLLYAWQPGDPAAVMDLSGDALISGNVSYAGGGGVYLIGNATLNMTGGTINGNTGYGNGGGVCVAGAAGGSNNPEDYTTAFTMSGGTISNNYASTTGGGIYLNSNDVVLKGGLISGNEAGRLGGGVYVSTQPYTLHMYNVLITGNIATYMGGGMWFCPFGKAEVHMAEGGAIFGNTAAAAVTDGDGDDSADDEGAGLVAHGVAGDDFVAVGKGEGSSYLPNIMLGGGKVTWFQDGGVYNTYSAVDWLEVGEVDESVPRFDPANPGDPVTEINSNSTYSLKAQVSTWGAEQATQAAALVITGNTAPRGGGVGSNGTVIIGTEGHDNDEPNEPTIPGEEDNPDNPGEPGDPVNPDNPGTPDDPGIPVGPKPGTSIPATFDGLGDSAGMILASLLGTFGCIAAAIGIGLRVSARRG